MKTPQKKHEFTPLQRMMLDGSPVWARALAFIGIIALTPVWMKLPGASDWVSEIRSQKKTTTWRLYNESTYNEWLEVLDLGGLAVVNRNDHNDHCLWVRITKVERGLFPNTDFDDAAAKLDGAAPGQSPDEFKQENRAYFRAIYANTSHVRLTFTYLGDVSAEVMSCFLLFACTVSRGTRYYRRK
jgi:hypothetical protein